MPRAAATTRTVPWWRLTLAQLLPAEVSSSSPSPLSDVSASVKLPQDDRPTLAPGRLLSTIPGMHWCRLSAGPRSSRLLHRRPSSSRVHWNNIGGCRAIASALSLPASADVSTASASDANTAPSVPLRDRHACPECGKRFLCESNLVRHRATRHGVQVASAIDVARARLAAHNVQLRQELARVQARVKLLREGPARAAWREREGAPVDVTIDAASAYPSAVLTGRLMEVDEAVERAWRLSGRGLGTGVSYVNCVGTVLGPVEVGTLRGAAPTDGGAEAGPPVLQFVLEAHGYRERRPGQLKMYRAHLLVRYVAGQPYHCCGHDDGTGSAAALSSSPTLQLPFKVREGDVVRVQGHYALHKSYDMVSKQSIENVVVEADAVGMLRLATARQGPSEPLPLAAASAAPSTAAAVEPSPPPPLMTPGFSEHSITATHTDTRPVSDEALTLPEVGWPPQRQRAMSQRKTRSKKKKRTRRTC
ncbi:hypothetical protein JKF63_07856 [Porcisia hertigi]|uniref:C2H2-type domain-containing protein n=1 Tax=Porcisia hertigi TaxID=2761500 RepID=A0A836LMP3_9TRYP|nr:hypothetical protein JKF63_07856 [Porcisia hertigi]